MALEKEISRSFYEETYYANVDILDKALKQRLHYYKIKKVFELYTPSKTDVAIDLGSAWGAFSYELARLCKTTIGIDFSEKAAKFSTRHMKELGIPNLAFMCADVQNTGIKDCSVDVIISAGSFLNIYIATNPYARSMIAGGFYGPGENWSSGRRIAAIFLRK